MREKERDKKREKERKREKGWKEAASLSLLKDSKKRRREGATKLYEAFGCVISSLEN